MKKTKFMYMTLSTFNNLKSFFRKNTRLEEEIKELKLQRDSLLECVEEFPPPIESIYTLAIGQIKDNTR